jgi:hypothetical protein
LINWQRANQRGVFMGTKVLRIVHSNNRLSVISYDPSAEQVVPDKFVFWSGQDGKDSLIVVGQVSTLLINSTVLLNAIRSLQRCNDVHDERFTEDMPTNLLAPFLRTTDGKPDGAGTIKNNRVHREDWSSWSLDVNTPDEFRKQILSVIGKPQ